MSNNDTYDMRGALFAVSSGDELVRSGQFTINGSEENYLLIKKELPSGKTIFSLCQEVGVVFANHDKKTEKSPDMSGSLAHKGQDYEVAGWKKVAKSGLAYTSVKITLKEEQKPSVPSDGLNPNTPQAMGSDADPTPPIPDEVSDDEIPF